MTLALQAAGLAERDVAEDDSDFSDTETTLTGGQSQAASQSGPSQKATGASKAAGKKSKKQPGASAVSEADEARELAEMRKGGFITGKGKKGENLRTEGTRCTSKYCCTDEVQQYVGCALLPFTVSGSEHTSRQLTTCRSPLQLMKCCYCVRASI